MASADTRAARRYASALFQVAHRQGITEKVEADLQLVSDTMTKAPALQQMWHSPLIPAGKKRDLVKRLLEGSIQPLTLSFLRLLVDKRREDVLEAVRHALRLLSDRERKIVRAEALFAVPPTQQEEEELQRSLEQRTGEHVVLSVTVQPAILGGVVVRMEDTLIDGSVRGTLERLRDELMQEA